MWGAVFSLSLCSSGTRGGKIQIKAEQTNSQLWFLKKGKAQDSFADDVQPQAGCFQGMNNSSSSSNNSQVFSDQNIWR